MSVREMEQNRMSFKSLIQNKKEERELIAQQIRTYLAEGNHIKVYPAGTTGINYKKMNEIWEKKFRNNSKKGELYDRR